MAVGDEKVRGFIEFELVKLAERINVGGNLTDSQIEFIASQLVNMFPNETLADFKLCFERGASGVYGKIFKLDGVELGVWMRGVKDADGNIKQLGYLDEKYQVMENEMMKEKDNVWERAKTNTDWLKLWQESIEKTDKEGGVKTMSQNLTVLSNIRSMTDKEINAEGKEKPKRATYFRPSEGDIKAHNEKIRKFQEMTYRERHPGATDEEVKIFLEEVKKHEAKTEF